MSLDIRAGIKRLVCFQGGKDRNAADYKYGIITRNAPNCGLFSFIITFMGGIQLCLEKGLIPVMDLQSYKNIYLKEEQVGRENAWEFFFEQPCGISLDEIERSQAKVIDVDQEVEAAKRPNLSMDFLTNEYAVQYWRGIFRDYLKFNAGTWNYISQKKKEIFDCCPGRKLGVLCRGTDYTDLKPYAHPVQPDVNQVIEKTLETQKRCRCDYIVLATEDKDIYTKFSTIFRDRLIAIDTERLKSGNEEFLADTMKKNAIDAVENGLNYLTSIYLLGQCDCLLAGRTSGSVGALLMAEKYEYQFFWNLGKYGIDDAITATGKREMMKD